MFVELHPRKGVEKSYGVGSLPALVHFSDGIPVLFHGDLGEYDEVLEWILGNLEVSPCESSQGRMRRRKNVPF